MFIRQIINNNVVLVRDTGGKELIVVAKGIGYHGRTGAAVDLKRYPDHRLFVPDDAEHARIRQIYNEIPEDQFDLAVQLLQMEQQARGMDGSIPITAALMLADHLHEMVARLKNGLELHNALTNEIMMFYKKEFTDVPYFKTGFYNFYLQKNVFSTLYPAFSDLYRFVYHSNHSVFVSVLSA